MSKLYSICEKTTKTFPNCHTGILRKYMDQLCSHLSYLLLSKVDFSLSLLSIMSKLSILHSLHDLAQSISQPTFQLISSTIKVTKIDRLDSVNLPRLNNPKSQLIAQRPIGQKIPFSNQEKTPTITNPTNTVSRI